MSKPTVRVLTLLELLQSHNRLSGSELAKRLGVDVRTVRRYIQALEQLGIPVTTEQGRDGGYMLVAGFKLPPMMFTEDETLALALGMLSAQQLHISDADAAISSIQAKLARVMPPKLAARSEAIARNIQVMFPAPDTPTRLTPLLQALEQQQRVQILYCAPQQAAQLREVDPYGLLFRGGKWYMCGFCHLRQALRTFRLDRLQQVQLLNQQYQRPADFDSAAYFRRSLLEMPGNLDVQLVLHTDVASARQAMGSTADMLRPVEGGLLLSTRTDSCQCMAQWLCQLPFDFTIVSPVELKQALREQAQRLLALAKD